VPYLDDVLPLLFASIFDLLANQPEDVLHDWVKDGDKIVPWNSSVGILSIQWCCISLKPPIALHYRPLSN
jgi:hypothetical protein